jgi:flagellar biogenesis protein FliO
MSHIQDALVSIKAAAEAISEILRIAEYLLFKIALFVAFLYYLRRFRP